MQAAICNIHIAVESIVRRQRASIYDSKLLLQSADSETKSFREISIGDAFLCVLFHAQRHRASVCGAGVIRSRLAISLGALDLAETSEFA